ncbi:MAG: hypothetical protein AB9873_14860 [Syntrophobacteraceae bacterium]
MRRWIVVLAMLLLGFQGAGAASLSPGEGELESQAELVMDGVHPVVTFTFTNRSKRVLSMSFPQGMPMVAQSGERGVVFLGQSLDASLNPGETRQARLVVVPLNNPSAGAYVPSADRNLSSDFKTVREVLRMAESGRLQIRHPDAGLLAARYALLLHRESFESLRPQMTQDLGADGVERLQSLLMEISDSPAVKGPSPVTKTVSPSQAKPVSEVLFRINNVGRVYNGPSAPSVFSANRPFVVTRVQTYHWNDGRGASGGTVSFREAAGRVYGPWQVTTADGSGARNVYWDCRLNVELPAGRYTVIDSDAATWSHNSESAGRGFVLIEGYVR